VPSGAEAHVHQAHRAQALERGLLVLLLQRGERIDVDAGQGLEVDRRHRAVVEVDKPERLAHRGIAADARAHVLGVLEAILVHVAGHLAAAAGVGALRFQRHQHVAAVGGEAARGDGHVVAEKDRRGHARAVAVALRFRLGGQRVAVGALACQRFDQAQFGVAKHVGPGRCVRVLLGLQHGDRALALGGEIVSPPFVADAVEHGVAIGGEAQVGLVGGALGELLALAGGQRHDDDVAVAQHGHARAAGVEHRGRGVGFRGVGGRELHRLAAGGGLAEDVAHRRARALQRVGHVLRIGGPPELLDRRADPVRVRHGEVERQLRGAHGGGRDAVAGREQGQGEQGGTGSSEGHAWASRWQGAEA